MRHEGIGLDDRLGQIVRWLVGDDLADRSQDLFHARLAGFVRSVHTTLPPHRLLSDVPPARTRLSTLCRMPPKWRSEIRFIRKTYLDTEPASMRPAMLSAHFIALCSTPHATFWRQCSSPTRIYGFLGALMLSAISMWRAFSTMRGMLSASHWRSIGRRRSAVVSSIVPGSSPPPDGEGTSAF